MRKRKFKRIKKKKQLYHLKAFWMILAVLVLGSALGYALFFSPWFRITAVQAQGQDAVMEQKIVSLVAPQNIFLFNKKAFSQTLKEMFPEITDIKVAKKLPQTITITFQRRAGVALWCKSEACFLVDAKGVVFQEKAPGDELLVAVAGNAKLGETFLPEERWAALLDFQKRAENLAAFKELNLRFRSLEIVSETRANWETFEQWEVYVDLAKNIEWQLLKLQAVLEKKIPPSRRSFLLYIDLRFGDQAYVQYR